MPIRVLPDYMINKLKAGEVVERPASICKELLENSLDAHATHIVLHIVDGGKKRIQVEDDGSGIAQPDMGMVLTRYATSKITGEEDLYSLSTYGFRGEALASIAEVSNITVISKTAQDATATKLTNVGGNIVALPTPVAGIQGTTIIIEDLFYNTPVRQKFLKSSQTEYFYCYDVFLGYALMHWDKHWELYKDDRVVFDLPACEDFLERFGQLFKKERIDHLRVADFDNDIIKLYGVFSDASLTFGSPEHIKLYVNQRPVQDRILKKAILQAYERQIGSGLYPLAFLFVDIPADYVDVNVHPRKQEVRFADPGSMYQIVLQAVRQSLGENKIMQIDPEQLQHLAASSFTYPSSNSNGAGNVAPIPQRMDFSYSPHIAVDASIPQETTLVESYSAGADLPTQWRVIGQLWDMYVLLEDNDSLYIVDQHALAERIAYEKMKLYNAKDTSLHTLLQPVSIETSPKFLIEQYVQNLKTLGFEVEPLSEKTIVVYAVPTFFRDYADDLEKIVHIIMDIETPSYDKIADTLYAMKACKASIKAGQRLYPQEMQSLIKQGLENIPGMFACQHGRPFMRRFEKGKMDAIFDRH